MQMKYIFNRNFSEHSGHTGIFGIQKRETFSITSSSMNRVPCSDTNQWGRLEIFDDGVVSDWQVQLVAAQDKPVVDGVAHQVDAGSHDECDDAEVDCRARQRPGAALNQLIGAASAHNWWLFRLANYLGARLEGMKFFFCLFNYVA